MSGVTALPFLRELLLFLGVSGVLIPVLQRWRVNPVLGFLLSGIVLGPVGLGRLSGDYPWLGSLTFSDVVKVRVLAELGVMFLMFMIGLELSAARFWALRRWVLGAGLSQWLLSGLVIATLACSFGNSWAMSIILGLTLALSSTAMVMHRLVAARTLGTALGQACFGVLMFQDLAVVPLLMLLAALSAGDYGAGLFDGTGALYSLGASLARAALVVLAIAWLGRRLIRPLFRMSSSRHQPDVFMARALLVTLGVAGLTELGGVSAALGALLAGMILAETEYRHEVEVTIEPFRGLLMGLFFMSVGMGIDLRAVLQEPFWLLAAVLGLFLVKGAVLAPIFRVGGLPWPQAIEGSILLGQGGEFGFVVLGAAMSLGLLPAPVGQFMLLVVSMSLCVTPLAARLAASLQSLLASRRRAVDGTTMNQPQETLIASGHVVIVGFGRVGQTVATALAAQGVPYVVIERDAARVAALRERGMPVWFGTAPRVDLLAKMHLDQAAAVVLALDDPSATLQIVRSLRRAGPGVAVLARARDEVHAAALRAAGAVIVVPETLAAGLQLAAHALAAAGVPEGVATATVDAERERRIHAPNPEG